MAVILIHGMNVMDGGAKTIDRLKPLLKQQNEDIKEIDYGWFNMLIVRLFNNTVADKLIDLYQPGDRIIAHSNGCAITARAIDKGLKVKQVTFIHPALDAEWVPPKQCRHIKIKVFHSIKDKVGYLALLHKLLSPLNFIFGKTYYGAMMTYGATKGDQRFKNINDGCSHSGCFQNPIVQYQYAKKGIK